VIGLERGVVRLEAYKPEWARFYEQEKARLQDALGDRVLDIQHVGSTAIPGCSAKPILDIAIAVENFEQAFACVPLIEQLGYEFMGEMGISRRHYFVKRDPRSTHHIHMLEQGSAEYQAHLLFRDYLCAHPEEVKQYEALKQHLAERYPADREAYTEGKAEFITQILARAAGSLVE
jgi:GrpB-like predicted nucleotidyltransferase (UPF0157 family)